MTYDKINKRFDISDRILDEQNAKLDDMVNEMNKRDEKWEGDGSRLKENTKGELKQVNNFESENENNEETDDNINNEGVSTIGNYNEEIITNKNQVMNYKVSGGVKMSKDEILLNKNNGDVLSKSGGDNESRKLVEVRGALVLSLIHI